MSKNQTRPVKSPSWGLLCASTKREHDFAVSRVLALCLMAGTALLSGCAGLGHGFNYNAVANLELRKTQVSDCAAIFGAKPNATSEVTTADGKFETERYQDVGVDTVVDRACIVVLEFKDGSLNAFTQLSNLDNEQNLVLIENASQVKIHASTKADVLRILGIPNGKALCPSLLSKSECEKCVEVWCWQSMGTISKFAFANGYKPETKSIVVSFDKDGTVSNIETTKSSG
jgi:hypothetical protein